MTITLAEELFVTADYTVDLHVTDELSITARFFKLPYVQPEQLLPACYHATDSLFFYASPDDSFRFLAGGLHPVTFDEHKSTFLQDVQQLDMPEKLPGNLPVLFSRKFFNLLPNDQLWNDFSHDWQIPDFVFYSTGKITYLCIFSEDAITPESLLFQSTHKKFRNFDGNHTRQKALHFSATPDYQEFMNCVKVIQAEIASGSITKAVAARYQWADLPSPDFSHFLSSLKRFPLTHRFFFKQGASVLSGASPELLLQLTGNTLHTEALAGTANRGTDREEDEAISFHLLHDEKELIEHKIVTDYITGILASYAEHLEYSNAPVIKKLAKLQHLWTPVQAKLRTPQLVFRILQELFPTPATCGSPRDVSYELINRLEGFSRGLYCGSLAWCGIKGTVDAFIPLRSALFKNNRVHIFSGGGIVAASQPHAEFEESCRKADTIKSLFFV